MKETSLKQKLRNIELKNKRRELGQIQGIRDWEALQYKKQEQEKNAEIQIYDSKIVFKIDRSPLFIELWTFRKCEYCGKGYIKEITTKPLFIN